MLWTRVKDGFAGIKVSDGVNVKAEKLPGPKEIPEVVRKYLINEMKVNVDAPNFLQSVVRKKSKEGKSFFIRIFDPDEAQAKNYPIHNYTSFDGAPDLVFFEGSFDEKSKAVELVEKRKVNFDIPLLSQAEILAKIEALREPGSKTFFFSSAGPASGGPLGRGGTFIELQPSIPGKKPRYTMSTVNVVDMQPVGSATKLWESNKPKDIAQWAKDGHTKRFC